MFLLREGGRSPLNMDLFDVLLRESIWSPDPWWEEPIYLQHSGLPLETIRSRMERLRAHFPPAWLRSTYQLNRPNAVLTRLCAGRGTNPFDSFMQMALVLENLDAAAGLPRKLGELAGEKNQAVLFELEVASLFGRSGHKLEFIKETTDKTPDFMVTADGWRAAVECKRLEVEQWSRWNEGLSSELMQMMGRHWHWDGWDLNIQFDPRLSELHMDNKGLSEGISEAVLLEIVQAISAALGSIKAPTEDTRIRVGGVATIEMKPRAATGSGGAMGGIAISPTAKLRRIITNGVLPALRQLEGFSLGVVAVYSDFPPDPELFALTMRAIVRARPALESTLAVAAIVSPITELLGLSPAVWQNPKHPQQNAVTALRNGFPS
jgi:hypothetical protein